MPDNSFVDRPDPTKRKRLIYVLKGVSIRSQRRQRLVSARGETIGLEVRMANATPIAVPENIQVIDPPARSERSSVRGDMTGSTAQAIVRALQAYVTSYADLRRLTSPAKGR